MTIVKICIHHGPITMEQVIINQKNGRPFFRCKLCYKITRANYYKNNKEKVDAKCREYKAKDPEKVKAIKLASRQKHWKKWALRNKLHREKYKSEQPERFQAYHRNRKSKARDTLSDGYVARLIRKRNKIPKEWLSSELISVYRTIVAIKRIKRKQNEERLNEPD